MTHEIMKAQAHRDDKRKTIPLLIKHAAHVQCNMILKTINLFDDGA